MSELRYPINNVYGCIQGEGSLAGTPMILLRLQGCGVGCAFCDTKETWALSAEHERITLTGALGVSPHYVQLSAAQIAAELRERFPYTFEWVLITGGEPAQYDLEPLVEALHADGYKVALETSGTATGFLGAGFDWVCVSPKINMPGGKVFMHTTLLHADEVKFVIGKQSDVQLAADTIEQVILELKDEVQICLQPMSMSEKATAICLKEVMERGWRLSLQLHKYLDLP